MGAQFFLVCDTLDVEISDSGFSDFEVEASMQCMVDATLIASTKNQRRIKSIE